MHPKIHFIGIDEPAIAELALALHQQGCLVTGSAAVPPPIELVTQLAHHQILPNKWDFSAEHIDPTCTAVVIGRKIVAHHREVLAAQQLGIPVYSYPAYIYHCARHQQRILVLGDEQTIVQFFNIAIHVLNYCGRLFDYVTHLSLQAAYSAIQIRQAPIIFLQGDIGFFSDFDPRISAFIYQPHMVVMADLDIKLSNSENWKEYKTVLSQLADAIPKAGKLVYNADISGLHDIGVKPRIDVQTIPFYTHPHKTKNGQHFLTTWQGEVSIPEVGAADLKAIASVYYLLKELAVRDVQFYEALSVLFQQSPTLV